jgi:hypothetical protein
MDMAQAVDNAILQMIIEAELRDLQPSNLTSVAMGETAYDSFVESYLDIAIEYWINCQEGYYAS